MLEVRTGCRIHFGLMELAEGAPRRFAGLGLMLAHPGFILSFRTAGQASRAHSIVGPADISQELQRRIQSVIDLRCAALKSTGSTCPQRCEIMVRRALPLHSGLGAGTQLACAVAVGLELLAQAGTEPGIGGGSKTAADSDRGWSGWQPVRQAGPLFTPRWLVQHAGRGLRSAVGLTGFLNGGLLLDAGYSPGPARPVNLRPLTASTLKLPKAWRVVLIVPECTQAVHGTREAELLEQLGSAPNPNSAEMLQLARRIGQGLRSDSDFTAFTDDLDQYMEWGARLFSPYQQGLYNGAQVAEAVALARSVGLRGVGQSSWGPTVFGFTASAARAEECAHELAQARSDWSVDITEPADCGAETRWLV